MFGFIASILTILVNMVLDWIKWDIGHSSLRGQVPVTIFALMGAVLGALFAGLFGAVVCGVVGACLGGFYQNRVAASPVL